MGNSTVYIRSGFGNTLVSEKKPICIPIFQSLASLDRDLRFDIKCGIETAIISKDNFFIDVKVSVSTVTKFQEDIILQAYDQGSNRKSILESAITEHFREFFKLYEFTQISEKSRELEESLLEILANQGIESVIIENFEVSRTGLDEYDLENVLHFKMAKEIVTQIARVKIKDKEFIDKCRKTISHFDIVDE